MALVTIIIQDGADGQVSFGVSAEPALPRTILDGKPTKAQAAAALMLNALTQHLAPGQKAEDAVAEGSRILTLN